MNKFRIFLILSLLVLIVPSLTPRSSVIAHSGIGGQVHNPHVARIPLNDGLDPMGLLGVPLYQDGGYWQQAEKSALVGDSLLFAFGYEKAPVEIESVFMQEGVSGTFSGGNPEGSITYSITGVQADGPSTENIDGWATDYYGSLVGFASRSYTGHVVGDSITLSYGLSGEKFCKDLLFSSGEENIKIGCYGWDSSTPSGSITFAAPAEGQRVTFSLKLWKNSDIGRTDIIVSGTFSRQRPAELPAAPVTEPDPPGLPPIDPTSPPQAEVVLPPFPTPSQTDSDGLWTVVIGGMAIMGVAAAGIAAVGVAGAAAVLVARAKRRALENNLDQLDGDEIVGYILELSTGEITLKVNQPQPVRITCWQVASNGSYKHAPQASIHIQPPPVSSLITVSPAAGQGSFVSNFYLNGVPDEEMYQISVTATGGGQSASASINIKIDPGLMLTLTTPDDINTLEPGADEGLWACANITPEGKPPYFDADVENSKITFEVVGPNANWIDAGQEGQNEHGKWVYILARSPSHGAMLSPGNPKLLAKYQVGNSWLVEELKLELHDEYELKLELIDVPKTTDITYNSQSHEWQASSLLIYWVNANEGKTPVDPGFEYGFPEPPIQVEPPVLEVKSFVVHGSHQYLLNFDVEQDLEQFFDEDLTKNNGMVKITIEAIDSEQAKYLAEINYQVRPYAIPIIYFWKDSPGYQLEADRDHNGITLNPGELVADEKDEIGIGAFLVRSDKADDFALSYDQPLKLMVEPQADLRGEKSWDYILNSEGDVDNPDRYSARLKSKEVVFFIGKEHEIEVQAELSLDENRYPNYLQTQRSPAKIKVKPLEIFLKLWVFPGEKMGTSRAGALMFVPTKEIGLKDYSLNIDIRSHGFTLTADQTTQMTDKDGLARWTLFYRGMNWNNYHNCNFTVRCGVTKADGGFKGTQVHIDIGHNVNKLLTDFYNQRNRPELRIENPDWRQGAGFISTVKDWVWPDYLSGPVTNLFSLVSESYYDFVCEQIRNRIVEWIERRRYVTSVSNYNEDVHTSMNGIDYTHYFIWLFGPVTHTFAGIFLADVNADPIYDPRFLDPWWVQGWSNPIRRTVNGLYTKARQLTLQLGTVAALSLLALVTLKFSAWIQGVEKAMSVATRVKLIIFGGGGAAVINAIPGVYSEWPTGLSGKTYVNAVQGQDGFIIALRALRTKPIKSVDPIVRW